MSGNKCSFPDCQITFLNSNDDTNFSNVCHIEDANQNTHKADRYNSSMTHQQRADYNNLILLCPNHHVETNNAEIYTVKVLREMKRNHEASIAKLVNGNNQIAKHPSLLSELVNQIGNSLLDIDKGTSTGTAPNTEEKILYNNVIVYKDIIQEYSVYQGKLNTIYEEIENQGSLRKDFMLENIRMLYLKEKAKYSDIKEIRKNADMIIKEVENGIWNILDNSTNLNQNLPMEVINVGILTIIVDAFMRCKILEEPILA